MNHEWRCTNCGCYAPDHPAAVRCNACGTRRPDVAEYRKLKPEVVLESPGAILWKCGNCSSWWGTAHNSCAECFATRPVNPVLRIAGEGPKLGIVSRMTWVSMLCFLGWGALVYGDGIWDAIGVVLLINSDQLWRNR